MSFSVRQRLFMNSNPLIDTVVVVVIVLTSVLVVYVFIPINVQGDAFLRGGAAIMGKKNS